MRCDVVAVGTELLLGQIVDTNSAHIGEQLAAHGIASRLQVKVGDNVARIESVLRQVLAEADAVIVCGGLGPTHDDVTREAIASVMGAELVLDESVADVVRDLFAQMRRPMSENNLRQAMVPVGATVIPQVQGTAPGLICPVPSARRRAGDLCRAGCARRDGGDVAAGGAARPPRPRRRADGDRLTRDQGVGRVRERAQHPPRRHRLAPRRRRRRHLGVPRPRLERLGDPPDDVGGDGGGRHGEVAPVGERDPRACSGRSCSAATATRWSRWCSTPCASAAGRWASPSP